MVVARIGDQVEHAAGSAGLGIAGAEHQPCDARMHHRHRAHRAGLQRHVKRAAQQAVIADVNAGLAQRDDFRMRRRIALGDVAIPAFAKYDAIARHQYRTDRDFVVLPFSTIGHVLALEPEAVMVDAAEHPAQAWTVLQALRERDPRVPVLLVVERDTIERYPWHEVADEFLYPGAPAAEVRVRLAMLRRRVGSGDGSITRLGPLALDIDTYRVTASGRPLDLTYKEFELLRFLASNPGRVYTRPTLLREVWGYDFYGGTRTVDVHVRRLRAKLGPEHEHLIETVRGVGYRSAAPES